MYDVLHNIILELQKNTLGLNVIIIISELLNIFVEFYDIILELYDTIPE